jgi:hypothetical protein
MTPGDLATTIVLGLLIGLLACAVADAVVEIVDRLVWAVRIHLLGHSHPDKERN